MRKIIVLMLLALPCSALGARQKTANTYTIQIPRRPDYSAISWLVGNWTGKMMGGVQGSVLLSVAYRLEERFLLLQQEVAIPAADGVPATHESLMGILSAASARSGFDLMLYSSNGFVSRYHVYTQGSEVDFSPAGGPSPPQGWLFRWVFTRGSTGQCTERVDAAPPGKPFFTYYTAQLSRVTETSQSAHVTPAKKQAAKERPLASRGGERVQ